MGELVMAIKYQDRRSQQRRRLPLTAQLAQQQRVLKANGRLEVTKSTSGQSSGVEVMQLILNSGFDLANLVLAIAKWRIEARDKAAPVTVTVDERRTELSVADLADEHVVLRALTGAADPRRSEVRADRRGGLHAAAAAAGRQAERGAAQGRAHRPEGVGHPRDRLHTVEYPRSAADIRDVVSAAAAKATDTLLVYFAGTACTTPTKSCCSRCPTLPARMTSTLCRGSSWPR